MSINDNYNKCPEKLGTYAGQWVATINGEIVAHNKNLKKALMEGREKYPGENPLMEYVRKSGKTYIFLSKLGIHKPNDEGAVEKLSELENLTIPGENKTNWLTLDNLVKILKEKGRM